MIMALLSAAASFSSCDGEKITDDLGLNADFYITSDKDVIQSNGTDAAVIKVFLKGEDITSKATIYDGDSNPVNLKNGRFTATADGEYKFWASYGTYSTFNRNYEDNGLYTVKAISHPVPASVADPQPANTGFVHRAFLTQYTGTSCGYCPYMIKIVKSLVAENVIPTKAVLAAAHSGYNSNDAAAINKLKSPSNYPYLQVDLVNGFAHKTRVHIPANKKIRDAADIFFCVIATNGHEKINHPANINPIPPGIVHIAYKSAISGATYIECNTHQNINKPSIAPNGATRTNVRQNPPILSFRTVNQYAPATPSSVAQH